MADCFCEMEVDEEGDFVEVEEYNRLLVENEKLRMALNPRRWTKEMIYAWHKSLPDTELAFKRLLEACERSKLK